MIFDKRTELQAFMDNIVRENGSRIVKVTSYAPSFSTRGTTVYMIDGPLFIIFENGMALIIFYRNVCYADIEYRPLTMEEKDELSKIDCNDFFNVVYDLYDYQTKDLCKRVTLNMDYDCLEKIEVRFFEGGYEEWEKGNIVTKSGTEENFGEIVFVMKNGNTVHIMPEHAEMDGYLDIWASTDYENIQEFNCGRQR